jgi:hypothetical protein
LTFIFKKFFYIAKGALGYAPFMVQNFTLFFHDVRKTENKENKERTWEMAKAVFAAVSLPDHY